MRHVSVKRVSYHNTDDSSYRRYTHTGVACAQWGNQRAQTEELGSGLAVMEVGYSSLRFTVGPCYLSVLNVIVSIYLAHLLVHPSSPWHPQVFSLCESVL